MFHLISHMKSYEWEQVNQIFSKYQLLSQEKWGQVGHGFPQSLSLTLYNCENEVAY